ncbi:hypothetical protein [Agrococcus sp. SGAir0287]|uniref:hypothetical protein n=1 Tax=Agrococcus sp. SGAir0287 TaxID=2070347 RepID=UPI0010CD5DA1|nr:hypothetical protein [Agrococcus sp. SGAir0287]QCR18575.1 hypothetical protein C1N71_03185 [Agrococcus sp. SGAir0287]
MSGVGERGVRQGVAFRTEIADHLRAAGFKNARARSREEPAEIGDILDIPGVAITVSSRLSARHSEMLRAAHAVPGKGPRIHAAIVQRSSYDVDAGTHVFMDLNDFCRLLARARQH